MLNYREPLKLWEIVLLGSPSLAMVWALFHGYGPVLGFSLLVVLVVVVTLQFVIALIRLLWL